jgi:hypothetical protein
MREIIRYLEARVGTAQPVYNVPLEPTFDNYNNRVSLEDLQLAMRMSSSPRQPDPFHLFDMASSPQWPDPFARHSALPSGPSYMSALPEFAMLARLPPPPMIEAPAQHLLKRKRESMGKPTYHGHSIYMPIMKKRKGSKGGGSFPLPSPTAPKPLSIPLTSYWKLWEKVQREVFRKRIHNSQVAILNDISITGQYSIPWGDE